MSAIRSCSKAVASVALAAFALTGCTPRRATTRIFAAASIAPMCAAVFREDVDVRVQPAASSTLARQILSGADADVFVSAHPEWIDVLERAGHVVAGSRRNLVTNALVLVRPAGSTSAGLGPRLSRGAVLGQALDGRLAIGDPAHVPAGRYARDALAALGLWGGVARRLAPCPDVRHALALVARGECALGIVYRTDALAAADAVVIEAEVPGAVVQYEVCRIVQGNAERSAAALARLFAAPAAAELRRSGFELP